MKEESKFESRTGSVPAGEDTIFRFITDMNNFGQFIPHDTLDNWQATEDSCSFEISPVGTARLTIAEKHEFSTVKYAGEGQGTTFFLWVQLKQVGADDTRVRITIKAELNPMMSALARAPLNRFLEKLINGLETYQGWQDVRK